MTAMFDALKFARTLRDGGSFTPDQAERLSDALSDAIAGEVLARADLAATEPKLGRKLDDLRAELAATETRLDRKIEGLRAELKQDIADLRTELKGDIRALEVKIEAAKADTIKWIVGIIGFQTVAIVGAAVVLARLSAR